jgi:hypothetical protein
MMSDSFFAILVTGLIALFLSSVVLLAGYRFFLFLLPVCGFVFGFALGAQSIQALFGEAFLSTITSWVVGFFVAIMFAVLSYAFYVLAVGLIGAALGYVLTVGLLQGIGLDFGFFVWSVGLAAAVALGIAVVALNVQKYIIILATSVLGAAGVVGTFLFMFSGLPAAQVVANPVRVALQSSPFWMITFLVLVALGAAMQYASTQRLEVDTYNRLGEFTGAEEEPLSQAA